MRSQIIPVQQCVDLLTAERAEVPVWADIIKARFEDVATMAVSPCLEQLAADQRGHPAMDHPMAEDVRNF